MSAPVDGFTDAKCLQSLWVFPRQECYQRLQKSKHWIDERGSGLPNLSLTPLNTKRLTHGK